MKPTLLLFGLSSLIFSLSGCSHAQSDAKKLAVEIQSTVKESIPGSLPTKEGGWTMKAKIDGKEWVADAMLPTEPADRIIGYQNKDYISFPYDRRDMVEGKTLKISESWAVDFVTEKDGICGGRTGEMKITKVDSNWVEGTFFFTVNNCVGETNEAPIEVTEGFFRVALKK